MAGDTHTSGAPGGAVPAGVAAVVVDVDLLTARRVADAPGNRGSAGEPARKGECAGRSDPPVPGLVVAPVDVEVPRPAIVAHEARRSADNARSSWFTAAAASSTSVSWNTEAELTEDGGEPLELVRRDRRFELFPVTAEDIGKRWRSAGEPARPRHVDEVDRPGDASVAWMTVRSPGNVFMR